MKGVDGGSCVVKVTTDIDSSGLKIDIKDQIKDAKDLNKLVKLLQDVAKLVVNPDKVKFNVEVGHGKGCKFSSDYMPFKEVLVKDLDVKLSSVEGGKERMTMKFHFGMDLKIEGPVKDFGNYWLQGYVD